MAAPKGNNNATKNKPWAAALEKELTGKKNAAKLRKLARALVKAAGEGNMQAMKEMGDRLDGKPAQSTEVTGPDGEPIQIVVTAIDETVL